MLVSDQRKAMTQREFRELGPVPGKKWLHEKAIRPFFDHSGERHLELVGSRHEHRKELYANRFRSYLSRLHKRFRVWIVGGAKKDDAFRTRTQLSKQFQTLSGQIR